MFQIEIVIKILRKNFLADAIKCICKTHSSPINTTVIKRAFHTRRRCFFIGSRSKPHFFPAIHQSDRNKIASGMAPYRGGFSGASFPPGFSAGRSFSDKRHTTHRCWRAKTPNFLTAFNARSNLVRSANWKIGKINFQLAPSRSTDRSHRGKTFIFPDVIGCGACCSEFSRAFLHIRYSVCRGKFAFSSASILTQLKISTILL